MIELEGQNHYTTYKVAEKTGYSVITIQKYCSTGKLKAIRQKKPKGQYGSQKGWYLIPESELTRMQKEMEAGTWAKRGNPYGRKPTRPQGVGVSAYVPLSPEEIKALNLTPDERAEAWRKYAREKGDRGI